MAQLIDAGYSYFELLEVSARIEDSMHNENRQKLSDPRTFNFLQFEMVLAPPRI